MKIKTKVMAALILIAMIVSNLIFPLQGIVYATENKTINFTGNNLEVDDEIGSVTYDCEVEGNSGSITFTVYNEQNQVVKAQRVKDGEAAVNLNSTSYEGFYVIATSNNVRVNELKIDIAGRTENIGQDGRLELPTDVGQINIESFNIKSINENKRIVFRGTDNLEIDGGSVLFKSGAATIAITPYNSDNTKMEVRRYDLYYDNETGESVPDYEDAYAIVNGTTYDGAYLMVTSNDIDVTGFRFSFGNRICLVDEDGKVDLTGCENVYVENKRIDFEGDGIRINPEDKSITMNAEIGGTEKEITFKVYNADGTLADIKQSAYWDDELQHNVEDSRRAEARLNTLTFDGAKLKVTSDVNLEDYKFSFTEINSSGRYEPRECSVDANGEVDLTGCDSVYISYENKRIDFEGDNIRINQEDKSITMRAAI